MEWVSDDRPRIAVQTALWPDRVEDRPRLGRPPVSRWETQAVVVGAGDEGLTARQVAERRGVGVNSIRRQLVHLERLGRLVREARAGLRGLIWRPRSSASPTEAAHG